jgi:hypothetical protein
VLSADTYDDRNPGFVYSDSWRKYSGAIPYYKSLHYTQIVGNTVSVYFYGPGFKLFYTTDNNRGSFPVWVDGSLNTAINAKTATVFWQHKYLSPSFVAGTHTIKIKHAGPEGSIIDVDAIRIFP